NEPLTLNAEFMDGTVSKGEVEITSQHRQIKRVWVTADDGEPAAPSPMVDAIMQADAIVLGPGSLFTSTLPNLMIPNVGQ
ncbi:2-phospho-L-lactate transferase CofD family protein, partial [Lactobacillus nasalidis]|uniref:2-phospho-L-lactate transferase CofD family protein n=1 Tax=Lactobacillus nasalidis TaxID=2797258 RepID=UPI001915202A